AATLRINIESQLNLLEAIRRHDTQIRMHIAGSNEEYGLVHPDEVSMKETNPLRSLSSYAASKVAQDRLAYHSYKVYGMHLVVALNILGLFLYLIVRPKETLGEAYERQLAEESLLAEAEQRVVCPTCKERVQEDYILCPTCRTRLKRMCPSCAKLIRPEWNICPYCAKDFDERDWTVHAGGKAAE